MGSELSKRGKQIRRDTIALSKANGGYHYGGSFSAVEILIALFDHVMAEDDIFILSKGHACWPYYVLLREKGFNPKLEGHPTRDPYNAVEASTGSLGHGFPIGAGRAMARKIKGVRGRVFVLMGDGECQEGTTWESMLIAAHHDLDNLVVIVDCNGIQGSGFVNNILSIEALNPMATQVGWNTFLVAGHDTVDLTYYLKLTLIEDHFPAMHSECPRLILAQTVKGKGVSFMEGKPEWHAKWPNPEEEAKILEELR